MKTRTRRLSLLVILMVVVCAGFTGCGHGRARTGEYNPYAYRAAPLERQMQKLAWDDDWEGVLELWKRYSHMCDDEVGCRLLVAKAHLALGRHEDAARFYRETIGTAEFWHDSDRYDDLNVVVLGGADETRCFRAALDPGYERAGHLLRAAEVFLLVGAYGEAVEACNAIGECGLYDDPNMLMARGEAHYQLGEFGDATRDFRRALASLDEEHARMRLRQMGEM